MKQRFFLMTLYSSQLDIHLFFQNHTRSSPDVVSDSAKVQVTPEAGGLDPKYFVQSTPGGTNYRQEIPQNLPANVRRGAGLVRRDV